MTKRQAAGLRFVGGQRFIFGVPRRDLEPEDLERLVYRDPRTPRLAPGADGFAEALERRRASLVKSGLYAETFATGGQLGPLPDLVVGESGPETIEAPTGGLVVIPISERPADPLPADEAASAAEEE
jgi:hypothetical protein